MNNIILQAIVSWLIKQFKLHDKENETCVVFLDPDEENELTPCEVSSEIEHQNDASAEQFFLRCELERWKEMQDLLTRFLQRTERIIHDYEMHLKTNHLASAKPKDLEMDTERNKTYARRRIVELYNLIEQGNDYSDFLKESNASYNHIKSNGTQNGYGIRAQFVEGNILIQLPLLGSNWRKTSSVSNVEMTYGTLFQASISHAVEQLFSEHPDVCRESFRSKTVCYFFVYNHEARFILDSDNHSTKAISDAICASLPSSDAGPLTSFYYKTIVRNWPPEGTYVVVSPGTFSPECEKDLDKIEPIIVDFWS